MLTRRALIGTTAAATASAAVDPLTIGQFLSAPGAWRIVADMFLLAAFAGLFALAGLAFLPPPAPASWPFLAASAGLFFFAACSETGITAPAPARAAASACATA